MAADEIWNVLKEGDGAVVAVALHDGHMMRPDLLPLSGIDEAARLREEDPYTGAWAGIGDTVIVATRSRFEVDLNRPRDKAVYRKPEDAWGLRVWKKELSETEHEQSLAEYDAFYAMLLPLLKKVEQKHGCFFIYDLHSYNHRRDGANSPEADPEANPEINIGTGTMDRQLWGPLVDGLVDDLRSFDYFGRQLDVRENVKFKGGGFPAFIHEHFPRTGCAVAIEMKKFWMDEWTGERDAAAHAALRTALELTVPGIRRKLAAR